jgi:hypothetical protein
VIAAPGARPTEVQLHGQAEAYRVAKTDAALAVRQGYRAHVLDRITGELDRYLAGLAQDGE